MFPNPFSDDAVGFDLSVALLGLCYPISRYFLQAHWYSQKNEYLWEGERQASGVNVVPIPLHLISLT